MSKNKQTTKPAYSWLWGHMECKIMKNNQAVKKGATFKIPSCEINGGGQEMAAMMLIIYSHDLLY